jgi:DNA-binding XRE family transcriptional regulator
MKRCAVCLSNDLREAPGIVDVSVPTASGPFHVRISGVASVKCGNCGESFLSGPDLGRAELLAGAEALARGLRDSQTFKFVRKSLGLRAADLGELLDVSAETVSRWENGHREADRSVWNAVADLVVDKLAGTTTTLERLRAHGSPRVPKRPVLLRLARQWTPEGVPR